MVDKIQLRLVRLNGFWCCYINSRHLFLVWFLNRSSRAGILIIASF
jgi:hypothetical protein